MAKFTSSFSSISILPLQNPLLPFFSPSPIFSQIRRKRPRLFISGPRQTNRSSRRNSPPERDMSFSIQMPARDVDDEPFLDSRNRTGKGDLLMKNNVEKGTGSPNAGSPSKMAPHKNRHTMSAITCFGVDLTPDNIAVAMVYFVQGVLGLSRLAVSFYLKDDLHLDPAETAVITGFSALPWLIKPLYGFISDSFPLFGYRRRSYLVLSGLLGALSWGLMALFVDSKYSAAFCILLGSLSVAFSDVSNSFYALGSIIALATRFAVAVPIIHFLAYSVNMPILKHGVGCRFDGCRAGPWRVTKLIWIPSVIVLGFLSFWRNYLSLVLLHYSAVAVLVNEQRVLVAPARGQNVPLEGPGFIDSSKYSMIQLWEAVKQPNVFLPTLFIFLWQATPHSDSAMFYFTTNKLGFTPEFLGRVKLVTSVASLLGVGLYNGFLKNVPMRKIFFATTTLGTALGMTQVILVTGLNRQLGISDEWFAIGDSLILTVLGQASFMPVLVLAARLCPQGMEATLFATLMSVSNGGSVIGGLLGAGLTQLFGVTKDSFDNLATLIILCNLSSLLPLPLLGLLPHDNSPDANSTDRDNIEIKSN